MTLTRYWNTLKIGEEQCLCPECSWSGLVKECNPRIDTVALCPKCGHRVEYKNPSKDNTIRRPG
jgi:DNA-directed RNA polymerase subunit RPC12/RpoP